MSEEWIKSNITESGNYPKTSFSGVLSAVYPTYNDNLDAFVLQLDFQDGKTYNIPLTIASDKAKTDDGVYGVHENGDVDGFLAIGQFLQSIERIDAATGQPSTDPNTKKVQTYFAWMDGNPAGFKTDPDIVGTTLYNVATPRQVGDNAQTSKYPDWTIGKIEGLQQQTQALVKKPQRGKMPRTETKEPEHAPKGKPEAQANTSGELSDIVLATLDYTPKTVREVYEALGKKYKPGELRTVFESLAEEGFVLKDGERYTAV